MPTGPARTGQEERKTAMTTLRMGLIGLGAMGRHHARISRQIEGVDLVAIADARGDRFGVAGELEVLPDVEALIAVGIDAAIVAVPTIEHEAVALKLAEAGVHTMIEKPIAVDPDAGHRVAQAFEAAGLVGAVGYVERCNPAILELRRRLAEGELGQVYQILTRRQGPFPSRISDVGVVKDLATHDIDLTAFVAASAYREVYGRVTYRSGREFEDMVVISGELATGVIVNHVVNWLSPMKERLTVVTGERGAFVADTMQADLTFYANGTIPTEWASVAHFRGVSEGDMVRYAISKPEPLRVEQEQFRDAVLGKPAEIVTMAESVHTLDVVEAVLSSSREGRAIRL